MYRLTSLPVLQQLTFLLILGSLVRDRERERREGGERREGRKEKIWKKEGEGRGSGKQ